MDWLQHIDAGKFVVFTLILTRISGLVMTAPIFGTTDIPMQVRGLLGVAITAIILPTQWNVVVPYPDNIFNYLVFIGCEFLVGLSLGLGVVVLFTGLEVTGQVLGQVSGLAIAEVFDPSLDMSVSVFSRFLFLITLAIFVLIGGHRTVMAAMLDTFATLPPGTAAMPASLVDAFTTIITQSFALGLRAAAPVVTAMLLGNIVLGIIGRTLPQLNILVIGFSINSLLLFGFLLLSLGAAAWIFQAQVEPTLEALTKAWQLPSSVEWLR